ncbi:trimeric intracellular cation channel family protein [Streptomyces sp. NBC_01288]|uniref:trimeric intracellular cation channel family protein n=1 Tax=Streptomyces sp. NBC_01288 TaxID=2903814 RepID=UPI002E10F752|nr:trimeric intracellular cation channel family protein [Streptomyces sp. NBC_01288]
MSFEGVLGIVQYVMNLVGILAFALSGAFLGVRKDFDVFGVVMLAEAVGLGGGVFRDLVIGVRPVAFSDPGYFCAPIVGGLVVFHSARLQHHARAFDLFDAAALGLFSVTGATKAFAYGLNPEAATTLGFATAVGGGIVSSVLAMELPPLLRADRDLYALPALVGAGGVAVLHHFQLLNEWTAPAAAALAFGLRVLALRRNWRTSRSRFWRNPFAGMRHVPEPPRPEADLGHMEDSDHHTVLLRRPRTGQLPPPHHLPRTTQPRPGRTTPR